MSNILAFYISIILTKNKQTGLQYLFVFLLNRAYFCKYQADCIQFICEASVEVGKPHIKNYGQQKVVCFLFRHYVYQCSDDLMAGFVVYKM